MILEKERFKVRREKIRKINKICKKKEKILRERTIKTIKILRTITKRLILRTRNIKLRKRNITTLMFF